MANSKIDPELSLKLSRISFLCAMLVVAIHCSYCIDSFYTLPRIFACMQAIMNYRITRIAVPFFFVIFGFFAFRDFELTVSWWVKKIRSRMKSLVLPYVVWSLISLVILLVINQVRKNPSPVEFRSVFWWLQALGITSPPFGNYVLWFVREIIMALFLVPIIGAMVRLFGLFVPLTLCVTGIIGWSFWGHLAYIAFGAFLALGGIEKLTRVKENLAAHLIVICLVWSILIMIVFCAKIGRIALPMPALNVFTYLMNGFGMVFVWLGYNKVSTIKVIAFFDPVLGSSFLIYAMHTLVGFFVQYPMLRGRFAENNPLTFCIVSYSLMVGVPTCCWWSIKHHAPKWVCWVVSGGR